MHLQYHYKELSDCMDVNIIKNKEYYQSISDSSMCDCSYCQCYRTQIKVAYKEVAEYLDSLGIDIEKPFEVLPLEPDENGMITYSGAQYIAFGKCEPKHICIIDNVEIRATASHPSTGIEKEHFVIELFPIKLNFFYEVNTLQREDAFYSKIY